MIGQVDAEELEAAAALLEASQDYRVLRRLQPRAALTGVPEKETRLGLFVDVETTGLDPSKDEIIELAMLPFRYSIDGIIVDVGEPTSSSVRTRLPNNEARRPSTRRRREPREPEGPEGVRSVVRASFKAVRPGVALYKPKERIILLIYRLDRTERREGPGLAHHS